MQSYLCIGGNHDGLNYPAHDAGETVTWPVGVSGRRETYIRETLSAGDVSTVVYRHESLTSEQVLDLLIDFYKAWCVNRPGGRR
jgi:hypothetical protein